MKPGHVSLAVIAGILVVVLAALLGRDTVRLNHVEYLLNQQQTTAAVDELRKLKPALDNNARFQKLLCRSYIAQGQPQMALDVVADKAALRDEPEIYYWKAVAAAHENDLALARAHAAAFIKSRASTALGVQEHIIRSLAGEKSGLSRSPQKDEHLFNRLTQAEQAVYFAWAAQLADEGSDFDAAVQLWHRALALGLKPGALLESAIEAAVFAGSVNSAATLLHLAGEESAVDHLYSRFLKLWQKASSGTIVLSAEQAYSPRYRLGYARALSWIALPWMQKQMHDRQDTVLNLLTNFHQNFPFDPFIQLRLGSVLELMGRTAEAEELYRGVLTRTPSLSTMLRYWSARGMGDEEVAANLSDAMAKLNVTTSASAEKLCGASPCVREAGQGIEWEFGVSAEAEYAVSFIGTGIIGEDGWPLLMLRVDGAPVQYIYISRANWECYTCSLALDSGQHHISLECISPATTSMSPSGFKLLSIIVSPAGET